jgi:hypothetical protein
LFGLFRKAKKEKRRSAGVYQHPTELILHAYRRSQAGFCVACKPIVRLSTTPTVEEIGNALRDVLNHFETGRPDPADWKEFRREFLRASGFKSWKALEGIGVRSCWIEENDRSIVFTPLRNGGNKGNKAGFQPFGREPPRITANAPVQDVGEMLLLVSFGVRVTLN